MAAEHKDLPGCPSRKLLAEVRRVLWLYVQCRPQRLNRTWLLAWEWAAKEADHSLLYQFSKRPRKRWPRADEIATRYLFLSILDMQASGRLRMGPRAQEMIPESVRGFMNEQRRVIALMGPKNSQPLALSARE